MVYRWSLITIAAVAALTVYACNDERPTPPLSPGSAAALSVTDVYTGEQLHGAIFTTTPDGGVVNANVQYQDKREVYLDGGPPGHAPITAAGLPSGLYVFQITDPPGKVLLSSDPAKCRVVRIDGGIIKELVKPSDLPSEYGTLTDYYGSGNPGTACHVLDGPDGVAGASGHHDTNIDVDHGADGAIVVQMMPFLDTPNPGGVYKAWITPLQQYVAKGGTLDAQTSAAKVKGNIVGYARDAGFAPPLNKVKTDNFKVKLNPPFIRIDKLVDANYDGLRAGDAAYAGAGGWPVTVTEMVDGSPVTNDYNTPTGNIGVPLNSTVMVCERVLTMAFSYIYVDGVKTTPLSSPTTDADGHAIKCVNVNVGTSGTVLVEFGNVDPPVLRINKYVDANFDGLSAGDNAYTGWPVTVTINSVTTNYSTPTGNITLPLSGTVTVCEKLQANWYFSYVYVNGVKPNPQPTPTTDGQGNPIVCVNLTAGSSASVVVGFGNIQSLPGRMTGGSGKVQITPDVYLTSGFTIHCDLLLSNNLEINWPGNTWHITKPITQALCLDDPAVNPGQPDAPFDTFIGKAEGELNGVAGSTVTFTFVDAGEPGKIADRATIVVKDKFGATVLSVLDQPIGGNLQAHEDQPHK